MSDQTQTELLALWHQYRDSNDIDARDRIITTLTPFVRAVVLNVIRIHNVPTYCDADDYLSCGAEALVRCLDRFDPDKGTLQPFAGRRIHGAVLDELRGADWAPRSLRRIERQHNDARRHFAAPHGGRNPSRRELASKLAISDQALRAHTANLERATIGSLDIPYLDRDSDDDIIDTLESRDVACNPEHVAMHTDAMTRLRCALNDLPARDLLIIVLLNLNGITLRRVGVILGVSESYVCQVHARIKRDLRTRLAA